MARKPQPEGKKYNFMDTYGDMVTLLLCFFVLLFSMSTVEDQKYNAYVEALADYFGSNADKVAPLPVDPGPEQGSGDPTGETTDPSVDLPADLNQLSDMISEYIEQNQLQGSISVTQSESGATFLRLTGNLLFAGDSARLLPDLVDFLNFLAPALVEVQDQILQVRFIGHTATDDSSPVNDWLLSAERAGNVSNFIAGNGFSPYKINSQFVGKYYPIADNTTAEGRQANRRVDIVILSNDLDRLQLTLADAMRLYFPDDDVQFFEGKPEELPDNILTQIPPAGEGFTLPPLPDSGSEPSSAGTP